MGQQRKLSKDMTQEQYEAYVIEAMYEDGIHSIVNIPGIWEIVLEHYNNAALEKWERDHPKPEEGTDDDG